MDNGAQQVNIFFVEDNPTDAELCIRSLTKHDFANNLTWVKDGAGVLNFFFGDNAASGGINNVPKVTLLDLRLPKIDGLEVLRKLKADERTKKIPAVVLTSSKHDRDVMECYNLGINSYVSKPVKFEAFSDTVAKRGLYWLLINRAPA